MMTNLWQISQICSFLHSFKAWLPVYIQSRVSFLCRLGGSDQVQASSANDGSIVSGEFDRLPSGPKPGKWSHQKRAFGQDRISDNLTISSPSGLIRSALMKRVCQCQVDLNRFCPSDKYIDRMVGGCDEGARAPEQLVASGWMVWSYKHPRQLPTRRWCPHPNHAP